MKSTSGVFDQYWEFSIKVGKRTRRGSSSLLEVHIHGPSPQAVGQIHRKSPNKVNPCDFVTTTMTHVGRENMAIGKEGERTVCITNTTCEDLEELRSTMKRQTPDYPYKPSMPHNLAQGSSSSLLMRTY